MEQILTFNNLTLHANAITSIKAFEGSDEHGISVEHRFAISYYGGNYVIYANTFKEAQSLAKVAVQAWKDAIAIDSRTIHIAGFVCLVSEITSIGPCKPRDKNGGYYFNVFHSGESESIYAGNIIEARHIHDKAVKEWESALK